MQAINDIDYYYNLLKDYCKGKPDNEYTAPML